MLHKGIEIRSAHSRISLAEILSRPVALDLDNLFKREKTLLLLTLQLCQMMKNDFPPLFKCFQIKR